MFLAEPELVLLDFQHPFCWIFTEILGEKNGGEENLAGKRGPESEGTFCAATRNAPWIGPGSFVKRRPVTQRGFGLI